MAKLYVHGKVELELRKPNCYTYRLMSDGKWLTQKGKSWKISQLNAKVGPDKAFPNTGDVIQYLKSKGYVNASECSTLKLSTVTTSPRGETGGDQSSPSVSSGNPSASGSGTTGAPNTGPSYSRLMDALYATQLSLRNLQAELDSLPSDVHGDEWWCDWYNATSTLLEAVGPDETTLNDLIATEAHNGTK